MIGSTDRTTGERRQPYHPHQPLQPQTAPAARADAYTAEADDIADDIAEDEGNDAVAVATVATADDDETERTRQERDARFERDALPWLDDVYRFAMSLTRDAADADDVVQDTFLRAYRSWHTFQPGTDCRRWLFTICRNAFLRSRERERHQVELEDGDVEAVAAVMVHVDAVRDGVDIALTQIDLAPALADAVARLHEPFRSAVVLVDVEDQSYEAASEILGVPIGTVRSRLFRGRRLLQEMLFEYAADAGFATAAQPPRASASGTTRSASGSRAVAAAAIR
jgi:RNA polymerase sigma-70 factor (ECF subfamily)